MSTAQHLRNVPIFSDLKDTDLNIIAEKMVSRSYEKGKMILLEELTNNPTSSFAAA